MSPFATLGTNSETALHTSIFLVKNQKEKIKKNETEKEKKLFKGHYWAGYHWRQLSLNPTQGSLRTIWNSPQHYLLETWMKDTWYWLHSVLYLSKITPGSVNNSYLLVCFVPGLEWLVSCIITSCVVVAECPGEKTKKYVHSSWG